MLDPFAGSGTACAVAEKLNRRRIGMDLNETAAITATLRLKSVLESRDKKNAEPLLLDGSEDIQLVLEQGAAESIKKAAVLPDVENDGWINFALSSCAICLCRALYRHY